MYGLLGELLGKPTQPQPTGDDRHQWMKVTANQADGIPIGFTTYRPADLTGFYPEWREFAYNVGDVDLPPVGIPMGPRHYEIAGFISTKPDQEILYFGKYGELVNNYSSYDWLRRSNNTYSGIVGGS